MNERIAELWNKAAESTKGDSWSSQVTFVEKFAELIVEECAEVASDYDGAHYVGTAIKEHFGVK